MGYGSEGRLRAKGKETKDMELGLLFRGGVLGRSILRVDCLENVPSVPGFSRILMSPRTGNVPSVPGFLSPDSVPGFSPDSPGFVLADDETGAADRVFTLNLFRCLGALSGFLPRLRMACEYS